MAESANLTALRSKLLAEYQTKTTPSNVYRIPDATGTIASQFPVSLGNQTPAEDQKWALREELVGTGGIIPGVGQAVAPEEYYGYVQGKQEEETMNQFFSWVMQQANLKTPEGQHYWFSKFPWMRNMRIAQAEKQNKLDMTLARININGPQNDEDFLTIYLIQQGLLKVPTKPTHLIYEETQGITNNYVAGLFSPLSQKDNMLPKGANVVEFSNPLDRNTIISSTNPGSIRPNDRPTIKNIALPNTQPIYTPGTYIARTGTLGAPRT